ncbi:hypothetical protein HanRHA438_Chr09g0414871 [Helianthus annuus]|nr:hypothetical protein HanRHA438_Chr09g0414871 [Helianthus annuus]
MHYLYNDHHRLHCHHLQTHLCGMTVETEMIIMEIAAVICASNRHIDRDNCKYAPSRWITMVIYINYKLKCLKG